MENILNSEYDFFLKSNDNKKLKFHFILKEKNQQTLAIKAIAEDVQSSMIFLSSFTEEDFNSKKIAQVLRDIKLSSQRNDLSFVIKDSKLLLSYSNSEGILNELTLTQPNQSCYDSKATEDLLKNLFKKIEDIGTNLATLLQNGFTHLANQGIETRKIIADLFNEKLKNQESFIENIFRNLLAEVKEEKRPLKNKNDEVIPQGNDNREKNNKEIIKWENFQDIKDNLSELSELKICQTIRTSHMQNIYAICILKDRRIVSSGDFSIIAYNQIQPHVWISHPHKDFVCCSLCVLKNGDLVSTSAGAFENIKIWRIDERSYSLIQTLYGHSSQVSKVIELEDGNLCSCSYDKTLKIWDKKTNYKCIITLEGQKDYIASVLETKDYIVSISHSDKNDGLKIRNKSNYELIKTIQNVYCNGPNAFSKINDRIVVSGGNNELMIVDIESSQVETVEDYDLGWGFSLLALGSKVIFGNQRGEICCYDLFSRKITFKSKFHNGDINCIIRYSDNKIISCSKDKTLIVYNISP